MTTESGSTAAARSPRQVDPSDAYWYGIEMNRMILGFDMPPPDRIRAALRSIATETILGSRIDPAGPTWLPVDSTNVDAWLDDVIVEFSEPVTEPSQVIELETGPLESVPFQLMLGPRWLAFHEDHVVGDGWSSYAFLAHLLRVARAESPARPLPWTELPRYRRSARAATLAGTRIPTLLQAWKRRDQLRGGPYQPAHESSSSVQPTFVYQSSPAGFTEKLRQVRDEKFPGASIAGVTLAGLRRSIGKHVAEPRPGTEVLFNTRSGVATQALGNYSAGLFLVTDDDTDPLAVSQAMAATRNSGLPGIASAASRWRRPPRGDERMVAAPTGAPRLTMSFTPRHGPISHIPGTDDGTVFCLATVPNGIETITITGLELPNRLCLTLSFYEQAWSSQAVQTAVHEFFSSPVDVLAGGGS